VRSDANIADAVVEADFKKYDYSYPLSTLCHKGFQDLGDETHRDGVSRPVDSVRTRKRRKETVRQSVPSPKSRYLEGWRAFRYRYCVASAVAETLEYDIISGF
jgi:hypothetical protein